jgi:microcystin-dependent protein
MGFVGSNTILNDGSSPSELTLRITNTLKRNPSNPASSNIMFSKDTSAPSKFIISFDSGDENKEWALGTNSQVNNIKVKVNFPQDSQWIEINNSNVGSSAEWTINIPESLPQLDASQFIQIKLSEIITGHSSGHTNVYVHYENISGYWDGQFVCTIEKCPLLYRGGNVGIGIANQLNAKLDIRVKQDDSTNALRVGKENSDYLTVLNDGNVGIGTTNPSEKLEVAGNIKSSGLSVSGNVSIGTITTNSRAKLYVDGRIKDKTGDVMPVGSILPYAGEQAPEGWLFCDGQSYNQFDNKYADLYQVIQNKYGRDGNKFKVPDLKGRVPVGYGDGSFGGIGNIGGAKTHTLGINEMPSHAHNVTDQGHFHNVPCYEYASSTGGIDEGGGDAVTRRVDTNTVQTGISIEIKGGGQAHNNLQPYLTVNFIIKC